MSLPIGQDSIRVRGEEEENRFLSVPSVEQMTLVSARSDACRLIQQVHHRMTKGKGKMCSAQLTSIMNPVVRESDSSLNWQRRTMPIDT